ncbi:MAG: PPOX class F420-dependent oxidoreductase [Mycobacteriales bacterium]
MEVAEALDFLRTNHQAVLATLRRDGTPQLTPVTAAVDAQGRVVISTRETAIKTANVRREPRAWLCAFPNTFYGRHVQIEARVNVLSLPEAMEPLVEYYRSVSGEHPDWADYREAMRRERRCLLELEVVRAGPDPMALS